MTLEIADFSLFVDPPDGVYYSYYGELLYSSLILDCALTIRDLRADLVTNLLRPRWLGFAERAVQFTHRQTLAALYLTNLENALARGQTDYALSATDIPWTPRCRTWLGSKDGLYPYAPFQSRSETKLQKRTPKSPFRDQLSLADGGLGPLVVEGYLPMNIQGKDRFRFTGWAKLAIPNGYRRDGRFSYTEVGDLATCKHMGTGVPDRLRFHRLRAIRLAHQLASSPVQGVQTIVKNGIPETRDFARERLESELNDHLEQIQLMTGVPLVFFDPSFHPPQTMFPERRRSRQPEL